MPEIVSESNITSLNGAVSASKPVFTLDEIIRHLTTSWEPSHDGKQRKWTETSVVNYYIGGRPFYTKRPEVPGLVDMTSYMKDQADLAFSLWDDLISINLDRTNIASNDQIQFEHSSITNDNLTYASPYLSRDHIPDDGINHIDREEIWINTGYRNFDKDSEFNYGAYGFKVYVHEIGHSLGLSHPGHYNAKPNVTMHYNDYAEYEQDYRKFSLMSYFGANDVHHGWVKDTSNGEYLYPSTPMIDDISAIQSLYGADYSTRSDDTVYGFNNTSGRDIYDSAKHPQNIYAIWDGGGVDTIDTSGFAKLQYIDLRDGHYSSTGGMRENVSIARNAIIENAIGGSLADTIKGNDVSNHLSGGSGNDTLNGGASDDIVLGQDGSDSAVGDDGNDFVSGGFGSDTVLGNTGNDLLFGDDDDDLVDGNDGDDLVHGGTGIDTVFGSAGSDQVYGEGGDDFVGTGSGNDFGSGGFGNDEVHGEEGHDLLFGDDGDDGVYGGDGDDLVYGGTGSDYLTGDAGNDQVFGQADGDHLSGGAGNDTLDGGAGGDLLFGNSGDDVLTGGTGTDVFAFGAGDGLDRILDFVLGGSEADVIAFNGGAFADFAGVQAASRQDGTDVVIAYGAGDALTLAGVQLGALSAANFTFA